MVACGWAHCKRNGYKLTLSEVPWYVQPTILDTFLHKVRDCIVPGPPTEYRMWSEPHFHYAPIPPDRNCLQGYFQSSKYFADLSGSIRDLFDPPSTFKQRVVDSYSHLLTNLDHKVVVHVRRTDYVGNYDVSIHNDAYDYYRNAMATIEQHITSPEYVVFSDDIEWCREKFSGAIFVDEPDPDISLFLMSRFRHFIIANSTFSWWGAWLADATTVVAPDRWFVAEAGRDCKDIYEPSWILVPTV